MSRVSRLLTTSVLLAATGCVGATECSCVAPHTAVEVSGTVTAGATPLAGAVIEVRVAPGECVAGAAPASDLGSTVTAANGGYEVTVGTTRTGAACVIVMARKYAPDLVAGTQRIDLTLPPTLGGEIQRIRADVAATPQ